MGETGERKLVFAYEGEAKELYEDRHALVRFAKILSEKEEFFDVEVQEAFKALTQELQDMILN